jgi:DNA-binding response OmpR family regulator
MTTARLLVVDDDSTTRWALHSIFRRRGWEVVEAENVAQGLSALDTAPGLIILDLNLPDGAGETVLKEIRSRALPIRVAVCSSTTDSARVARVRALDPDILLSKPYDLAPILQLGEAAKSA